MLAYIAFTLGVVEGFFGYIFPNLDLDETWNISEGQGAHSHKNRGNRSRGSI